MRSLASVSALMVNGWLLLVLTRPLGFGMPPLAKQFTLSQDIRVRSLASVSVLMVNGWLLGVKTQASYSGMLLLVKKLGLLLQDIRMELIVSVLVLTDNC